MNKTSDICKNFKANERLSKQQRHQRINFK